MNTTQILVVVLGVAFLVVSFAIYLCVSKRNSDKGIQNIASITQAATKAEEIALRLFCITMAVDDETIPDARLFPAWCAELFRLNGKKPSNIVERLKWGVSPRLPNEALCTLSLRQRQDILALIDEYRAQQPVR